MRLAYLTTDEVNQALAVASCMARKISLSILTPMDCPFEDRYDGVLCDWDSWPTERREDFLAMSRDLPGIPTAVHGYYLPDEIVEDLMRNGVLVYRTLEPQLFRELAELASAKVLISMRKERRVVSQPTPSIVIACL